MPMLTSAVNGFWKRDLRDQGEMICRAALLQARTPIFYETWGIPDTLEGRFDLACLHVALVLRVLKGRLAQNVFDAFFSYTELTLREVGVSDLRVGKQIKKCATFFYGAMKAYNEGLDQRADLEEALLRNVYGNVSHPCLSELAAYVRDCEHVLSGQDIEKKMIIWPKTDKKEG